MSVLNKIFKSYSEKEVKRVKPIVNKINGLEEELLGHDKEYEGEVSLNIEHELLNKLKNELDVAKKNVGSILDSYIKEYDEAQRQLDKAISKLQKLKAKVIKKGE